jgi:Plavaka transposase
MSQHLHTCQFCRQGFKRPGAVETHYRKDHLGLWKKHMEKRRKTCASHDLSASLKRPTTIAEPVLSSSNPFFQNHDPIQVPEDMIEAVQMDIVQDAPTREVKVYPDAGTELEPPSGKSVYRCPELQGQWEPFESEGHYKLAEWLVENKISQSAIDALLKNTSMALDPSLRSSFTSSYTLLQRIADMADGLGWESWQEAHTKLKWHGDDTNTVTFYHRDPIQCAKWLMAQRAFKEHMVYGPIKRFHHSANGKLVRTYTEMNTADWWWETQVH